MADARLLCEPIESPPALFQQLIDSNLNHNTLPLILLIICHIRTIALISYISHLTYTFFSRKVVENRVKLTPFSAPLEFIQII